MCELYPFVLPTLWHMVLCRKVFVFDYFSMLLGNRCIKGDKILQDGTVLHDSHAEILARRGFKRWV